MAAVLLVFPFLCNERFFQRSDMQCLIYSSNIVLICCSFHWHQTNHIVLFWVFIVFYLYISFCIPLKLISDDHWAVVNFPLRYTPVAVQSRHLFRFQPHWYICCWFVDSVVGTSSLRRAAQLRRSFPHLQIADVVSFAASVCVTHRNIGQWMCIHIGPEMLNVCTLLAACR